MSNSPDVLQREVPFRTALLVWVKIGLLSFGGPAGQIALMHRILVEERRWVSESRFLHALNFCMLLPGPEAQQLATYFGWTLHGIRGGIVAGTLFVLPGATVILILSMVYASYQEVGIVAALFFGIKAAVIALVIDALLRISRRALRTRILYATAGTAFVAIFFFDAPFPLIILLAAAFGAAWQAGGLGNLAGEAEGDFEGVENSQIPGATEAPSLPRGMAVIGTCLALWWGPLLLIYLLSPQSVFLEIGIFFSKMAVVTFGGAYAVLAYVAQEAVTTFRWLEPGEMLDGLGLAETTPGPLIMVVQFVGYLAAFRQATGLDPILAGLLGALLTSWVTFVPCFLWVLAGAPYIESLRSNRLLSAAMTAITAAVVGVILNLAVWFALHVLFASVSEVFWGPVRIWAPAWPSLNLAALALSIAALYALVRLKWSVGWTLLAATAAGLVYQLMLAN